MKTETSVKGDIFLTLGEILPKRASLIFKQGIKYCDFKRMKHGTLLAFLIPEILEGGVGYGCKKKGAFD
jgi:hypothetical protein